MLGTGKGEMDEKDNYLPQTYYIHSSYLADFFDAQGGQPVQRSLVGKGHCHHGRKDTWGEDQYRCHVCI